MTTHSQRALILYRRRRFINHLLTYLLTYYLKIDLINANLKEEHRIKLVLRFGVDS